MGMGICGRRHAIPSDTSCGDVLVYNPWSCVYGSARTILAVGSALTLAVNSRAVLFPVAPTCEGVGALGVFCVAPPSPAVLETARWLAVAGLILVASGWRPRVTGVLHWWLSSSVFLNTGPVDGGDHVTGVLTLIILPLTLTDSRRWHWAAPPERPAGLRTQMLTLFAASVLFLTRVQVAGIYLHAFAAKMAVEEWADGTAMYYWLTDHDFGLRGALVASLAGVLANGTGVVALTWGAIGIEVLLFLGLVASPRLRMGLFGLGVGFHVAIAIVMGLWSFSFAMTAALILYLWPRGGRGVHCEAIRRWLREHRRFSTGGDRNNGENLVLRMT